MLEGARSFLLLNRSLPASTGHRAFGRVEVDNVLRTRAPGGADFSYTHSRGSRVRKRLCIEAKQRIERAVSAGPQELKSASADID